MERFARILLGHLPLAWLALIAERLFADAPGSYLFSTGAFFLSLAFATVIFLMLGASVRPLIIALCAGLSGAVICGPLLSVGVPSSVTYPTSAVLAVGLVLAAGQLRPTIALGALAHIWAITSLARVHLGLGGSLIETDLHLFQPAVFVWIAAVAYAAYRARPLRP